MFKYTRFDFINQTKKSKLLKIIINIIIISCILLILYFNIHTKDDVKIISSNSRRIINTLNNYTETMSDFMVSNIDSNDINELNDIKNIRLSIDYFKEIKEKELKEVQELKIKQEKLKFDIEEKEKKKIIKEKAINLIKSYIPNYNSLINLISSHEEIKGYSNDFNCLKRIIKINNEELFNKLINIDYDKLEVSFNYLDKNEEYYNNTNNIIKTHLYTDYDENNNYYDYSHYIHKNYKENIIKNPIYQIIKNNLEIDYSYTEPNLTDEYNNKSKYFQQSLNDFSNVYNSYYINSYFINNNYKYYENYENDTYYLYYKLDGYYNGYTSTKFIEFLVENKILINNPNSHEIYNKHPYKFICNIPSKTINNKPLIKINNDYSFSRFNNYCCGNWGCYSCGSTRLINKNNIIDAIDYNNQHIIYDYNKDIVYDSSVFGTTRIHNYNSYVFELEKHKGSRMVKHNLTNNMIYYYRPHKELEIENNYFIENVFIDFPLISIYDEYEYIKLVIANITDIYNLPIIPPIKFI